MSKQPIIEMEISMLKNRLLAGFILCALAVSPLSAATVSFLVMEVGQVNEDPSDLYPVLWENSLLDVFFESGHIVSNSPIVHLSEKPSKGFPDEAERDFESAKKGGMGYFIVAIVDYASSDVSLRLFNTNSQKLLREQKYSIKTVKNTKDEQESIKKAIRSIAVNLN